VKFFFAILLIVIVALFSVSARTFRFRRSRIVVALVAGGWLHVGVGILIGPAMLGAVEETALSRLTPLLVVGLGWIGMMIGLQARREVLRELPRSLFVCAGIDIAVSVVVFGALSWFMLGKWAPGASAASLWPGVVLLTAASFGWLLETRSLRASSSPASARLALCVRGSGALCAMVAVLLYGLLAHASVRGQDNVMAFDWGDTGVKAAVTVLLAVMAGVIGRFALRLAGGNRSELLVIFIGLGALVAGAATSLGYSPMLASALVGAVIANLAGPALRRFERFIFQAEFVVASLFSILAGMLLDVRIGFGGVALAGALAGARYFFKSPAFSYGARIRWSSTDQDKGTPTRLPDTSPLYLAPIRQAPLAIALGVALVIAEFSPMSRKLLGVIVLTGLLTSAPMVFATFRAVTSHDPGEPESAGERAPEGDA
jgi:hypothetical protein